MARTTRGANVADDLSVGSELAKRRLKAILQTLSRERSIPEVCAELGINEAMFHKMRTRYLEESVNLLEPRKPGPKVKEEDPLEQEIERLRAEVKELTRAVDAAEIRTEVALVMPHLLRPEFKKKSLNNMKIGPRRASGGSSGM